MIKDHMPDRMLAALQSLLTTTGPQKPQRNRQSREASQVSSSTTSGDTSGDSAPRIVPIETSFTDSFNALKHGRQESGNLVDEHRLRRLRSLVCKGGRAPLATPERSFTGSLSSQDVSSKVEAANKKHKHHHQNLKPQADEEEFVGVSVIDVEAEGDGKRKAPHSNQIPCTATIHWWW